jgi:hypothetical protein
MWSPLDGSGYPSGSGPYGVDLFPTDDRTSDLACRIYLTPNGLAGAPTQQQLEAAIAAHG